MLTAGNGVGVIGDPARYIDTWLVDEGTWTVGHRRFLLDPFLETVTFGLVDTASADRPSPRSA